MTAVGSCCARLILRNTSRARSGWSPRSHALISALKERVVGCICILFIAALCTRPVQWCNILLLMQDCNCPHVGKLTSVAAIVSEQLRADRLGSSVGDALPKCAQATSQAPVAAHAEMAELYAITSASSPAASIIWKASRARSHSPARVQALITVV